MGNEQSRIDTPTTVPSPASTLVSTTVDFPLTDLPVEVRTQIYGFVPTLEPPAHVVIEPHPTRFGLRTRTSRTGTPALLTTSYETRRQTRNAYIRAFGSIDQRPRYFNPLRDTLHLHNITPTRVGIYVQNSLSLPPGYGNILEDFRNVRHLAIYSDYALAPSQVGELIGFPRLIELQVDFRATGLRYPVLRNSWIVAWNRDLASFWREQMNPEQVRLGLPVTRAPAIIFLDNGDVAGFGEMFDVAEETSVAEEANVTEEAPRARRRGGGGGKELSELRRDIEDDAGIYSFALLVVIFGVLSWFL